VYTYVLVTYIEGKWTAARPWSRWESNIGKDIKQGVWMCKWIHVTQDNDRWRCSVNMITNRPVPKKASSLLTSWATISVLLIDRQSKQEVIHFWKEATRCAKVQIRQ
jgi:hypothetical protein